MLLATYSLGVMMECVVSLCIHTALIVDDCDPAVHVVLKHVIFPERGGGLSKV